MEKYSKEEILAVCRSIIPHGMQKEIAKQAGVTALVVSNYLCGKSNNIQVEKVVFETVAKLRKERERLMKEAGFL